MYFLFYGCILFINLFAKMIFLIFEKMVSEIAVIFVCSIRVFKMVYFHLTEGHS